jgi:hypothetical protein
LQVLGVVLWVWKFFGVFLREKKKGFGVFTSINMKRSRTKLKEDSGKREKLGNSFRGKIQTSKEGKMQEKICELFNNLSTCFQSQRHATSEKKRRKNLRGMLG